MTNLVLMKMHAADGAGVPVQGVHAGSALRVPHFQGPAQGTGTQLTVRMYSVLLDNSREQCFGSGFTEPGSGCRLLLNPDAIRVRVRIQTKA
jgi:hypothetical protein